ncbi:ead/Ea22-like family protein [Klebsiella quasipneumoniae]|uniref:ead/Ea22-like family protein n=1 Tax=Klebsiella quasipneumoniae TaxID=1463165 RepID=UPI00351F7365
MTDITELAQSLKAEAEKATPGSWRAFQYHDGRCGIGGGHNAEIMVCEHISKERPHDAMFIALANPANILALVEALENSESRLHEVAVACATAEQALEKAQQQTTESENRVRKQNRHICELFDDNTALRQRIAELESRTVTFKLPFTPEPSAFAPWAAKAFYQFHKDTVKSCVAVFSDACAAAGIKVEAE